MDTAVAGLLLAAGRGRRMGKPKALVRNSDGQPWLTRAAEVLHRAGCSPVVVCLGAAAGEARGLLPPYAIELVVHGWEAGMATSLRAGLVYLAETKATAALVTLVDLPDQQVAAAQRVLSSTPRPSSLRRASYGGQPGHPVLIGADHWDNLRRVLVGDRGASPYMRAHDAIQVDCTDLGGGQDVDIWPS